MYTFLVSLIVLAAVLMVAVVLVQEAQGGGLVSRFSDFKSYIGVRKSSDIIERITWMLAVFMVVISVICSYFIS